MRAPEDTEPAIQWPQPLDLPALAEDEPPPPRFILPGWMPAGYATLLAGHGGAGKSQIALHLATCIGAGLPWWGLQPARRRVLYMSCEDRTDVLHWRLARICEFLDLPMADLDGWLHVLDLVGYPTVLWQEDMPTASFELLRHTMAMTGADVLFLDGISDAFSGNENDRAQVKAFVNSLLSLIDAKTGALLLLGHVNKPSAASAATSEGYSGSTGWHNSVRARWYLYPETRREEDDDRPQRTGRLNLELQKSNLGRADESLTFVWDDDAHIFRAEIPERGMVAALQEQAERQSILDALAECAAKGIPVPAATTGQKTAYHSLHATGQLAEKLQAGKAGRRRFWRRIEELRQMGHVTEGSIRRPCGHRTATLELAEPHDA